jgi:hypothetical protein
MLPMMLSRCYMSEGEDKENQYLEDDDDDDDEK